MKKPADLHRAGFGDTDSDYRIEADFRPMCTGLSTTILYGYFRTQLPRHPSTSGDLVNTQEIFPYIYESEPGFGDADQWTSLNDVPHGR